MTGYKKIRGGRYKCDFCDHHSYKTQGGIISHLSNTHPHELLVATKDAEIRRLKSTPPKIEVREKVVYKDKPKPKPKYWYVTSFGMAGIFCTSCKQVQLNVGIPQGQTIENTPHSCGNRTLLPVVEVK